MKVLLPYDDKGFSLELPDGIRVEGDKDPSVLDDPVRALRRSLDNPVSSASLRELVPAEGKVAVLVSDLTRGKGLRSILDPLLGYLTECGAGADRTEIFIATGLHRAHTREEIKKHLGARTAGAYRVNSHDARNPGSVVEVGTTPSGTVFDVNERVASASLVIALGTVSFHYFAGFGGGRKLLLPGVASERSILANHRLSLMEDPSSGLSGGCSPGNLEGNPVHEDMTDAALMLPAPVFAINTVFGKDRGPVFINSGDLVKSHSKAAAFLKDHFSFKVDRRYKAVIASAGGSPWDINLLQSHKAIRNAYLAVDSGGVLLIAAACPEGVGSESYAGAFSEGRSGLPERVSGPYTINTQTAVSTFEMTSRISIYVRSLISDRDLALFGFCQWKDDYTACLLEGIDPGDILLIRDSHHFLPVPGDAGDAAKDGDE